MRERTLAVRVREFAVPALVALLVTRALTGCGDDGESGSGGAAGRGGTRADAGRAGASAGGSSGASSGGTQGAAGNSGNAGALGGGGQPNGGVSGMGGAIGAGASDASSGAAGVGGTAGTAGAGGSGGASGTAGTSGAAGSAGSAGSGGSAGNAGMGGTAGVGGTAGSGGAGDRCDVAVHNPASPPQVLALTGNLGTHDPTIIEQGGTFYELQTGPRLPGKTSTNLLNWTGTSSALGGTNPSWIAQQVPGATDLWAPDLSFFGGQYHVYYSASTFGSNTSCIGHATRASLMTGTWTDRGSVVCSRSSDNWNAIDPNVIVDQAGKAWLAFGSFWSGIKVIELDQNGARANTNLHSIASRNGGAIEAPVIVRRCGYYYLFVSFDTCCQGANSTYNIRVGRSQNVLGPYTDKNGTAMMSGGGSVLVQGAGRWRGPGHNAVIFSQQSAYNFYHSYDADNGGRSMLRGAQLVWDSAGWPISGGP